MVFISKHFVWMEILMKKALVTFLDQSLKVHSLAPAFKTACLIKDLWNPHRVFCREFTFRSLQLSPVKLPMENPMLITLAIPCCPNYCNVKINPF